MLSYALRLLRVLVLLAVWRTVLADRVAADRSASPAVLTYTLIAEVFAEQLNVRTSLNQAFWEGTLVVRFLRPMGLVRQFARRDGRPWARRLRPVLAPAARRCAAAGRRSAPASPAAGAAVRRQPVPGDPGRPGHGVVVRRPHGRARATGVADRAVRAAIATLLSGALLPLAFYPWGLGEVFAWLPFAAMAWAPLAIYTGAGNPCRCSPARSSGPSCCGRWRTGCGGPTAKSWSSYGG